MNNSKPENRSLLFHPEFWNIENFGDRQKTIVFDYKNTYRLNRFRISDTYLQIFITTMPAKSKDGLEHKFSEIDPI